MGGAHARQHNDSCFHVSSCPIHRESQLEEVLRPLLSRADQLRRRPQAMVAARQQADAMAATLGRLKAERPWISSEALGAAARAVASLREWSVALQISSRCIQPCLSRISSCCCFLPLTVNLVRGSRLDYAESQQAARPLHEQPFVTVEEIEDHCRDAEAQVHHNKPKKLSLPALIYNLFVT